MVGQANLISKLKHLVDNNNLPRFMILVGPYGSDKSAVMNELSKLMKVSLVEKESKIADVREAIDMAYKTAEYLLIAVKDGDKLSPQARGAMLKLAEEPPNRVSLILYAENVGNVSEALRSRATIFFMDSYSPEEVWESVKNKYPADLLTTDVMNLIVDICETPGEAEELLTYNPIQLSEFVRKVKKSAGVVSLPNAMKIAKSLSLKAGAEGYSLRMFWKVFIFECQYDKEVSPEENKLYAEYTLITVRYFNQLENPSLSNGYLILEK